MAPSNPALYGVGTGQGNLASPFIHWLRQLRLLVLPANELRGMIIGLEVKRRFLVNHKH